MYYGYLTPACFRALHYSSVFCNSSIYLSSNSYRFVLERQQWLLCCTKLIDLVYFPAEYLSFKGPIKKNDQVNSLVRINSKKDIHLYLRVRNSFSYLFAQFLLSHINKRSSVSLASTKTCFLKTLAVSPPLCLINKHEEENRKREFAILGHSSQTQVWEAHCSNHTMEMQLFLRLRA